MILTCAVAYAAVVLLIARIAHLAMWEAPVVCEHCGRELRHHELADHLCDQYLAYLADRQASGPLLPIEEMWPEMTFPRFCHRCRRVYSYRVRLPQRFLSRTGLIARECPSCR